MKLLWRPLTIALVPALVLTLSAPPLLAQDEDQDENEEQQEAEEKPKFNEKDYRTFKAKNGKSLKARVVSRIDDERYSVETPDGKSFTLNVDTLSRTDQTYLELWEPGAILDLASADLADVLEKMNFSSARLTTSGDRLFVTASVGDEDLKFLLDQGRNFSILDPATATQLGLELGQGRINFTDAAGKVERSQQANVKEFSIGVVKINSHPFEVIDMTKLGAGSLPKDTAGTIGGELLLKLNALVDYGGKRLYVRKDQ